MKLLTLEIKNFEGVNAYYDFTAGANVKNADEAIAGLESLLFGNEAVFSGEIILNADLDGKIYTVVRNFASGVEVYSGEEKLSDEASDAVLSDLAVLSRSRWETNAAPCDEEAFLSDTDDYIKSFLSGMGFDREELDKASASYRNDYAITVAQAEALDELVYGNVLDASLEDKTAEREKLLSRLAELEEIKTSCARNAILKETVSALKEKIEKETQSEIYASREARLAEYKELEDILQTYEEADRLKKETEELRATLDEKTSELEFLEKDLASSAALLEEKKDNYSFYNDKVVALTAETDALLTELENGYVDNTTADNSSTDELSVENAVAEKAENAEENAVAEVISEAKSEQAEDSETKSAYESFNEWNEKYRSVYDKLSSVKYDYLKRRSVREGVAFETMLDDKRERLTTLEGFISSQRTVIAELQKEIASTEEIIASEGEDALSDTDAKRMKLFKSKILCNTLSVDISAAQQKIRYNKDARKGYAEDIEALTKAKTALNDYVASCENRKNKVTDRLVGIKARMAFCKEVDDMEYGAVCPVCHNRISDKTELGMENARLSSSYAKYNDELKSNLSVLAEYHVKLERIDERLGQLRERDRLCEVYIESLEASRDAKTTALNGLLKDAGCTTVQALEKAFAESDADFAKEKGANASDKVFLRQHLVFLRNQIEEINASIAPFVDEAENLAREINEMGLSYDEDIAPSLEGRSAYDFLEEIVSDEKTEDELFAELKEADEKRNVYLSYLLEHGMAAGSEAAAAKGKAVAGLFAEIRRNEEHRQKALEEISLVSNELAQKQANFEANIKEADALYERINSLENSISELLASNREEPLPEPDENAIADLKQAYDEAEKERLSAEQAQAENELLSMHYTAEYLSSQITDDEFDEEEYASAKAKAAEIEKEIACLSEKKAVSDAAEEVIRKKVALCENLSISAQMTDALADGDGLAVVIPVINSFLASVGEKAVAEAEGNGIKFLSSDREEEQAELSPDMIKTAVNCALNKVVSLAAGKQTVRFANINRPEETVCAAAAEYGVVIL